MTHPWGVACCIKLPVATLFVTKWTHDNVSSDCLIAYIFAVGNAQVSFFNKLRPNSSIFTERHTSTGCHHRWEIHEQNKLSLQLQQTAASQCRNPAMQNKCLSSPHNTFCWRNNSTILAFSSTASLMLSKYTTDKSPEVLPYEVEGLLFEEREEPGPVFVEIVSLTFTVSVLWFCPVSRLQAHTIWRSLLCLVMVKWNAKSWPQESHIMQREGRSIGAIVEQPLDSFLIFISTFILDVWTPW